MIRKKEYRDLDKPIKDIAMELELISDCFNDQPSTNKIKLFAYALHQEGHISEDIKRITHNILSSCDSFPTIGDIFRFTRISR